jgi:hypothetical protein
MVAHPGGGQVRDHVVQRVQAIDLDPAARRGNEAGVRLAHALGFARGARGVEDDRHIVGLDLGYARLPVARMDAVPGFAQGQQLRGADEAGLVIVAQAARVVVNDVDQAGVAGAHLQHLVDLFLVFGKDELDFGVLDHKGHFRGHGVLVQRNGHGAQALYGQKSHVQVRPVVADQRQVLLRLQTQRQQAAGQVAHGLLSLLPAPGLPDAIFFFAQCRSLGAFGGMLKQKLRERGLHSGS